MIWKIEQKFVHVPPELKGLWFVSRENDDGTPIFGMFPAWTPPRPGWSAINPHYATEAEAVAYVDARVAAQ